MPKKTSVHSSIAKVSAYLDKDKVKIDNILDKMERTFLPVGSRIGKYRIIEEIDRGGMAVVYKATQLDLDRVVALKVLPANVTINRRFVERFLSEAHAVAKLNHPGIVSIHEVSMENNVYFLAMDYVPGTNLFHFMNQRKPKLVDVLEIFIQLADALAYAHDQRILHRDLKLNNVIMRDNKVPVLIDFGLAKALEDQEDSLTKTGEIMGSPAYMAPERILGSGADARSDICSLGIMLYEVLTLKNPYLDPRSIHQTTLNVIEADPVGPRKLVGWLPVEMEAITLKAMHREPQLRYQTMKEFRDDLLRYQRGDQVLANPPSLWSKLRHVVRKHWPAIAIGLTVLVFAAALATLLYFQSRRERWNWKLITEERFDKAPGPDAWFVYSDVGGVQGANWRVGDGVLRVGGEGYSYLRFERFFTRDLRFEFDIAAPSGALRDVGFFICGDDPSDGYSFHIHRGTAAENGITYSGSQFIFAEYEPVTFPASTSYHVVVEKVESTISFKLNDVLVSRVYDFFPPLGKCHQNVGFFAHGGDFTIDDLLVYRLAMPELASPTIIADRFWEHGDLDAALSEYRDLLIEVPQQDIAHTVNVRMADCLIRLGDFDAADAMLAQELVVSGKSESNIAQILFLQAMLNDRRGDHDRADKIFFDIAERFGASPLNQSAVAQLLLRALAELDRDSVGAPEERIALLARRYPRAAAACGRAHLQVLRYFAQRGMVERARRTLEQIGALYEKNAALQAEAKTVAAEMYLGKRKKQQAIDLLNQAVSAHEPTQASWRAWLGLADIYEHDRNFGDAMTIYRKVYEESPKTAAVRWDARIRMGEIARMASFEEDPHSIFKSVVKSGQPFALPRLVAQFYAGEISTEMFAAQWRQMEKDSPLYLYHIARKALMEGEWAPSHAYFGKYLKELSPDSWEYVKAYALKTYTERR